MLISHTDSVTTQLIARDGAAQREDPAGWEPGIVRAWRPCEKYSDITKGTVLSDSFPYPAQANVKNFPGLKQYFADMKASGKK